MGTSLVKRRKLNHTCHAFDFEEEEAAKNLLTKEFRVFGCFWVHKRKFWIYKFKAPLIVTKMLKDRGSMKQYKRASGLTLIGLGRVRWSLLRQMVADELALQFEKFL